MAHSIDQVTSLPWQSTVLTWAGKTMLVLLLILITMLFIRGILSPLVFVHVIWNSATWINDSLTNTKKAAKKNPSRQERLK